MSSSLTPKDSSNKPLIMLGVYIPPELKSRLTLSTKVLGTTIKGAVLEALDLWFEKHQARLTQARKEQLF